ncbi:hypothetical protein [uncultured Enterovirga sp.]|uniref:hypothetical protein n=1 Tax=uncultured Enterovirga sp. TaxID=2026352 RepID=UPI0035CAC89F
MPNDHSKTSAETDPGEPFGRSPGQRGLALAAGFWVVIVALLGARVALFDEIAAARVADFVSTQFASLSSVLLR